MIDQPPGALVISLDFELFWGTREGSSLEQSRKRIEGARVAVPAMLDIFCEFDIHATWATVGLVMCEDWEHALLAAPNVRPDYLNQHLSPYPDLERLAAENAPVELFFAPELVQRINATPGQEIGSHTFSHYYCLEAGQSESAFRSDTAAFAQVCASSGLAPCAFVFPRNQVSSEHLSVLACAGVQVYRGTERSWLWSPVSRARRRSWLRLARIMDAYLPIAPSSLYRWNELQDHPIVNVPSSRFLRPYSPYLKHLEPLKVARIGSEMRRAAHKKQMYHLWWHPENFGTDLNGNLSTLRRILSKFDALRREFGFESLSMSEAAAKRRLS